MRSSKVRRCKHRRPSLKLIVHDNNLYIANSYKIFFLFKNIILLTGVQQTHVSSQRKKYEQGLGKNYHYFAL